MSTIEGIKTRRELTKDILNDEMYALVKMELDLKYMEKKSLLNPQVKEYKRKLEFNIGEQKELVNAITETVIDMEAESEKN